MCLLRDGVAGGGRPSSCVWAGVVRPRPGMWCYFAHCRNPFSHGGVWGGLTVRTREVLTLGHLAVGFPPGLSGLWVFLPHSFLLLLIPLTRFGTWRSHKPTPRDSSAEGWCIHSPGRSLRSPVPSVQTPPLPPRPGDPLRINP